MAEKLNVAGDLYNPGRALPVDVLFGSVSRRDRLVNFSGADPNTDPNPPDPNLAAEIANRSFFRAGESLATEQVAGAEDPQELFEGLREVLAHLEDGNVPASLEDRYGATRLFGMMCERKKRLEQTPDELVKKGWIKNYDKNTGQAVPKNRKYASLALSIEETPVSIVDDKGNVRGSTIDVRYNFGTPEQRKELSEAYEKGIAEFEARSILGDQIGIRVDLDNRDNLGRLVTLLKGGRVPKFRADHLKAIFNMPSVSELGGEKPTSPEKARELGDQVEAAMFLNLVMLNCGTKDQMTDLLNRPGAKFLIAKLAKEAGMDYDDWIAKNIGDYKYWVEDKDRTLTTYKDFKIGGDGKKTSEKMEKRGPLTEWSNISAFAGDPGEFGGDDEQNFIEKTIGGLVGSVEASWIAATMMRVIGAYASEGIVALPNGQVSLPLGEARFISGDDTGKFHALAFNIKEGYKNRKSGLRKMIGEIPDLDLNLFDWAQVKVGPNGERRSIWDAWLGTAEKSKIDYMTQLPTANKTKIEGYHRLGDLDFASLGRGFHEVFAIMQWLQGSDEYPTGVLTDALKVKFKVDEFELADLEALWKYITIAMNKMVMTKGSPHLYEDFEKDKKDGDKIIEAGTLLALQRNYLRKLLYARVHCANFTKNILPATVKRYNPNGEAYEQYVVAEIAANIKLALKFPPVDEESLKGHYLDENSEIATLGEKIVGVAVPATRKDVNKFLNDSFAPESPIEKANMKYVGRIKGKKTI